MVDAIRRFLRGGRGWRAVWPGVLCDREPGGERAAEGGRGRAQMLRGQQGRAGAIVT